VRAATCFGHGGAGAEVAEAEGLLRQVEAIARRARAYETQAASAGDLRAALLALREERATVALAARMTGRLDGGEAPAEPFRPIVWNSFDPETGEEIVFDPWKVFPDRHRRPIRGRLSRSEELHLRRETGAPRPA